MSNLLVLLALVSPAVAPPTPSRYFSIEVVDAQTGRGVPLVELRTVNGIRLWTDSAGVAVFHEPGLMDRAVFFTVSSPGYEFTRDGFGFRGRSLQTTPGGKARLQIRRINIAERLYRITGAGIYRDSVLAGRRVPIREPLLNGQVFGSDSVLNAVYRGKLYWVWGDTNRPAYPLGNFQVTGATSELPDRGGLAPGVGVDLRYFVDKTGFARQMAAMPGKGPTWITSLFVLPDRDGRDRLYASYIKVKPPMTVYARGLAVFNDTKGIFDHLADFDMKSPVHPSGHAFLHTEGGTEYIYFAHPYPLMRVPAKVESLSRPGDYEAFTCLKKGSREKTAEVERDKDGRPVYAWKKDTPVVSQALQSRLIKAGKLKREEALLQLRDRDTGKEVLAHSGSVYWNAYRRRWVLITGQLYGAESLLGEIWYAEADAPTGPWVYAVKVASHPRYSFYNPKHHPMFDEQLGRRIYFEGTYTHTFSGNHDATPRYDYNQLMYRLDLGDERLALPVAVYDRGGKGAVKELSLTDRGKIAFFALDRPVKGAVPVFREGDDLRVGEVLMEAKPVKGALFYALPSDGKDPPETTVPLYANGEGGYGLKGADTQRPICRVWRSPWAP